MIAKDKLKIDNLIKELNKYDYYYWTKKPIVPDSVYDTQYLKLKQYHNNYPGNKRINNYFSHLGNTRQLNTFKTFKHQSFIGSLDKIRTVKPLKSYLGKWTTDKSDLWNTDSFVIEDKCDGLSCVLYFNAYPGYRFLALTRGGGYYGSDITPEIKYLEHMDIHSIIKKVGKKRLIVRGELLIGKHDFRRLNRNHKYANERNAVSGVVNSKHVVDTKQNHVFLDTYTLVNRDDYPQFPTELSQIKFLKRLGFFEDLDVHTFPNNTDGKQALIKYVTEYTHSHREKIPFDIDGLTIKPNNTRNFINKIGNFTSIHRLGYNHHGPVHSKAWKFPPKSAVGVMKGVKWQTSANGKLAPVGILKDPVKLMGSIIKKASLGSLPDAWKRDLRIGDHVLVRRMNDVIPKFVRPIKQLRNGSETKIRVPSNAKLVGKYVYLKHLSTNDRNVQLQRWSKFVSKPCLNIQGLSIQTIDKLIQNNLIDPDNFASLWGLPNVKDGKGEPKVVALNGYGKKDLAHLENELNRAKKVPLDRVLLGLPIQNAGHHLLDVISRSIKAFSAYYGNYKAWRQLNDKLVESIPKIKNFGKSSVKQINDTFRKYIYYQLERLYKAGLTLKENTSASKPTNNKLDGRRFAITGTLSKPRKHFKALIVNNGGKLQSSVNTKTNYLICNHASSSSKYRKATKLNKRIINESQFMNMISD